MPRPYGAECAKLNAPNRWGIDRFMNILQRFFQSSLGKKYIMALTGLGLFLFLIGHLLGNLQIFLGPDVINAYGHFLQTTPELLWPARMGLLAFVGLHIWSAITLAVQNQT